MARVFPFPNDPALIRERKQSVTFRKGYTHLNPAELLIPVLEDPQALAPGKKFTPILPKGHFLEVFTVCFVAIQDIEKIDVARAGYPEWSVDKFQKMLMNRYDCGPHEVLTRIHFAYLQPRPTVIMPGDVNMTVMPSNDTPDRG